jgi:uncharacterized protein YlxW (UPF0749 family)
MRANRKAIGRNFIFTFLIFFFVFTSTFTLVAVIKDSRGVLPVRQDTATLIKKIKELERERMRLEREINLLSKKLNEAEKKAARKSSEFKKLKNELDYLRALSGLTEIEGPGVEITIKDSSSDSFSSLLPDEQKIVHDSDLRLIVNGLNLGGAEAISINGERIISVSSIRCVGPTILVNNKPISSPFIIKAIGDPDDLVRGLYEEASLNYYLKEVYPYIGISVKISKQNKVNIPAYSGYLNLNLREIREIEQ